MASELDGRNIVVTGGTGALGGAVIARLLADGAICHVPTSHASPPRDFAFAANDRVKLTPGIDLAAVKAVDAFFGSVPALWASIHLAGGFAAAPIDKADPEQFTDMMLGNALTAYLSCRAAVRSMIEAGTAGRIVNVTARPGLGPRKGSGMIAYAASKAAVAALTVALAEEVKGKGILVNAVAPSTLDTPANRQGMPDADFSKWVSLESAAEAIAYLASPLNRAMSGTLAPLYGRA